MNRDKVITREEEADAAISPPCNSTPRPCSFGKLTKRKEESCSELQQVFCYLDENGDGKISAEELQSCVRAVGGELSAEEAEAAVKSSDVDEDGMLGIDDFNKLMEENEDEEKRKELKEAFGMYEMEGSGCITPKSLKRMLSKLGESRTIEDCKAMIRTFDTNGDGVLSFEEFSSMMG